MTRDYTLAEVAGEQKMVSSPFEVVHLACADPEWFPPEELGEIAECVGRLGVSVVDWNVDKYFLRGLEHCQWFGMVPEFT